MKRTRATMSDSNPAENVELAAAGPAPGGRVPNDDDGCASTTPEKGVDDANAEAEGAAKSVGVRYGKYGVWFRCDSALSHLNDEI